jgi:CheY-like chemotaxis protein
MDRALNGWEALKELKADAELCDIPVIMVTVLNERGMAIPLGAADFVTKPVDRQRLAAILRDHCTGPTSASILVVEDDGPTREALCRSLASMGHAAHPTVNGRSGLDWLADHPAPSLILLDLMMPEMDGLEFLRELRQRPAFVDVPVIVGDGEGADRGGCPHPERADRRDHRQGSGVSHRTGRRPARTPGAAIFR